MTEVTKDLIFRVGFQSKDESTQKLQATIAGVTEEYKKAKAGSLEFVEAEKKVANASAAAGKEFERSAKATSQFNETLSKASASAKSLQTMDKIAATMEAGIVSVDDAAKSLTSNLKASESELEKINTLVEEFKAQLSGATKISQIDQITTQFKQLSGGLSQEGLSLFIDKIAEAAVDARTELVNLSKEEFINANVETRLTSVEEKAVSITKRLKELKDQARNTEDPDALIRIATEAGRLQDQLNSTNEVIKALSSSTFFTDTLVEGAETAVSSFTTLQGIFSVFESDNQALAAAAQRAQGALALLAGSQQLLTDLKKGDNIVTRLQIASQRAYAFVVGETTGALKAARVALAALGVGAVIAGIALLVQNWEKLREVIGLSNPARERSNEISKRAIEATSSEIAAIRSASEELKSNNTTQERRVAIIEDLKQKYPKYLENINSETSSYEEVEAALQKVNKALLAKASLNAAQELLTDKIKEKLLLQNTALEDNATLLDQAQAKLAGLVNPAIEKQLLIVSGVENKGAALQTVEQEINAILEEVLKFQNELNTLGGDPTAPVKETERRTEAAAAQVRAKLGTIAALEEKVNELRKKARQEALIGSEDFFNTVDLLVFAEKQLADAQALLQKQVDEGPEEGSIAALEQRLSELRKSLNETSQAADDYSAILQAVFEAEDILNEARKAIERPDLFGPRDAELTEAERHELALANIKRVGEERIIDIQIDYKKRRLELLKQFGRLTIEEETRINNEIAELELQKSQIRTDESTKEAADRKQRLNDIINGSALVIQNAFNTAQALLAIEQAKNDRMIDMQQQRVDEVRNIADQGNAELLQKEEKRLEDLNKKREKFVRQQQALIAIQLVAESALAIARAAAEGGAAAPFTIAATLLALTAGLAQAKAAASQAAFFKGGIADWDNLNTGGGYTGDGNPHDVSVSQGRKPYTYHKQEYIMDHTITGFRNNRKWFDHIRQYRVDLDEVFKRRGETVVIPAAADNKEIVEAIREIPAPAFYLNSKGIIRIVERNREASRRVNKIRRTR